MGTARTYNKETKSLSEHLYESIGDAFLVNGLKCKVIKLKTDPQGIHSNIPWYSNTSDAYVILGNDGLAKQIRIYKDHEPLKDIDWGHIHKNYSTNGAEFSKGVVHVQEYQKGVDRTGTPARHLNNEEIKIWWNVIKKMNPNAKIR